MYRLFDDCHRRYSSIVSVLLICGRRHAFFSRKNSAPEQANEQANVYFPLKGGLIRNVRSGSISTTFPSRPLAEQPSAAHRISTTSALAKRAAHHRRGQQLTQALPTAYLANAL